MLIFILFLFILMGLFGLAFHLTGALLAALIWLCIKVPLALIVLVMGIVCCCTLILIPVGIGLFKMGIKLLIPGI